MSGKRVLVTGASSGIGLSLTEQLVKDGHKVTITVRNQEKADATRRILAEKQIMDESLGTKREIVQDLASYRESRQRGP
ncbi:hypothetical protein COOONC_14812 [Cooperia oncophora]